MAKEIYIDSNGNEQLVSGTINNATMLPITSGSTTNTKAYIDSKTSFNMSVSQAPLVDGATLQIPQSILNHKMITIEVFRYGYCGAMTFYIEEITNGALGAGVQIYAYTGAKTFKVSNTGLITALTGFGTDGLNVRMTGIF